MKTKPLLSISHSRHVPEIIFSFILWFLSIFSILVGVVKGGMPFWNDPARDLLLAVGNLKKLTLIGPPSGIPGIFYGPYWIWILSIPILISKDPRLVALFTLGIPYLILFPLLIKHFKPFPHFLTRIGIVSLFLISYNQYGIYLWNPHLAPFLFLLLFSVLFSVHSDKKRRYFLGGFISALIVMFHISFGLGILVSSSLYLLSETMRMEFIRNSPWKEKLAKAAAKLMVFAGGIVVAFLPFLIFESRHGWMQVGAFLHAGSESLLNNASVVSQKGLTPIQIIQTFLNVPQNLFQIHGNLFGILFYILILLGIFVFYVYGGEKNHTYAHMLEFLSLSLVILMMIFLLSQNPVWEYHFIGFEMIVLLIGAIFMEKIKIVRFLFIGWVIFLAAGSFLKTVYSLPGDPRVLSGLASKEDAVKIIARDAGGRSVFYFIYAPSIYTFDYDYLFLWLMPDKAFSKTSATPVYLIIPKSPEAITSDFINYRTPQKSYKTEKKWDLPDKTIILKRVKTSSELVQ